jgi:hypothetical protein
MLKWCINYKLLDVGGATAVYGLYRAFGAEVKINSLPAVHLPLTTDALATITDCLFVTFENAWKHSGLGTSIDLVSVDASFDDSSKILTLSVRSKISKERRQELVDGKLDQLRDKYLTLATVRPT